MAIQWNAPSGNAGTLKESGQSAGVFPAQRVPPEVKNTYGIFARFPVPGGVRTIVFPEVVKTLHEKSRFGGQVQTGSKFLDAAPILAIDNEESPDERHWTAIRNGDPTGKEASGCSVLSVASRIAQIDVVDAGIHFKRPRFPSLHFSCKHFSKSATVATNEHDD
jgi:hypothetical protein